MEKKSRLINVLLICLILFGSIIIFSVGVVIPKMKASQSVKEKAIMVESKRVEDKKIADKIVSDKIIEDKRIADKVIEDKRIADKIIADKKIADEKARLVRVENDRIAAKNIEEKRISDEKVSKSVVTLNYTIDGAYISACNYPNGCTIQFKVGQSLRVRGNLINGATERIMTSDSSSIFDDNYNEAKTIKMMRVGGADITIVPEKYDWESAYTFHIVVSE